MLKKTLPMLFMLIISAYASTTITFQGDEHSVCSNYEQCPLTIKFNPPIGVKEKVIVMSHYNRTIFELTNNSDIM